MYLWLWHHLPGPTALRLAQLLVVLFVVITALYGMVFPWVDHHLGFEDAAVR
jgi:hypothetical protein